MKPAEWLINSDLVVQAASRMPKLIRLIETFNIGKVFGGKLVVNVKALLTKIFGLKCSNFGCGV